MANKGLKFISFFLVGVLSAACTAAHVPLKDEDARQISGTRMAIAVPQEEINAEVEKSKAAQYGGGGLLLALFDAAVESNRAKSSNSVIEPIRKEMMDFDFRKELQAELRGFAGKNEHLKVADVEVSPKPLSDGERNGFLDGSFGNSLLTLETTYQLSSDFKALSVVTRVNLWMKGKEKPIYLNTYAYHTPAIGNFAEPEDAAVTWGADHAALLRQALREGAAETAKMLSIDLAAAPPETINSSTPPLFLAQGQQISNPNYYFKTGSRYIIRNKAGGLLSASSDQYLVPVK